MIGMPSVNMVYAKTLYAAAISVVYDANRGWSWFSLKEPRRLVSLVLQLSFIAVILAVNDCIVEFFEPNAGTRSK